jgi:hypothetical protein
VREGGGGHREPGASEFAWAEDVRAYLALVVFAGAAVPVPDEEGRIPIPCPTGRRHFAGWAGGSRDARMNVGTGSWDDPACLIHGNLALHERYRSRCNPWAAQKTIQEAVALFRRREQQGEQERVRQAEAQAEAIAAAHNLSGPARRVFKIICLSPGIARSDLQRRAHLPRAKFKSALRELRICGLIRWQHSPSTAGRTRKAFFTASP